MNIDISGRKLGMYLDSVSSKITITITIVNAKSKCGAYNPSLERVMSLELSCHIENLSRTFTEVSRKQHSQKSFLLNLNYSSSKSDIILIHTFS